MNFIATTPPELFESRYRHWNHLDGHAENAKREINFGFDVPSSDGSTKRETSLSLQKSKDSTRLVCEFFLPSPFMCHCPCVTAR